MLLVKSNAIASPLYEKIKSFSKNLYSKENIGKHIARKHASRGLINRINKSSWENSIRAQQETEKVKKPMEITMKQYIAESRLPESAVL
ncbi:hypothetical protein HHK36_031754 [Tetracentron sinense]|uniref:Uncharacterized protein n=1 Tax=Tetracentron sinense TaxID=13715 RepID=A0A834Y8M7_TETSI|nr:hypothetical protein HHK36_031754 [Tetracentron sinense]